MGQVAGADVDGQELHLRIILLRGDKRFAEQVAGHDDDGRALGHGLVDGQQAGVGAVSSGLIVGVFHVIGFSVGFDSLPASLVEGLVVDGADVGHQSDLLSRKCRRDSKQQNQNQSQKLFHGCSSYIFSDADAPHSLLL